MKKTKKTKKIKIRKRIIRSLWISIKSSLRISKWVLLKIRLTKLN